MSGINTDPMHLALTTSDVMIHGILPNLDLSDWSVLCRVCTVWKVLIQDLLWPKRLKELTFGKEQWLSIPGVKDVGEEPVLSPIQIEKLKAKLLAKCPFFNIPDDIQPHRFQNEKIKKAWQTHMLIFFPATINGEPRTVNSIGKIFHFQKDGESKTVYEFIYGEESADYRNKPAPNSYFALITKDVVPGSRGKTYKIKEDLVKSKGCRVPIPNEAITSIVIMNLGPSQAKKEYFFGREGEWATYTTTTYGGDDWRLVVGAAASSGDLVDRLYGDDDRVGVAGVAEVL